MFRAFGAHSHFQTFESSSRPSTGGGRSRVGPQKRPLIREYIPVKIQEAAPKLSAAVPIDRRIALHFGVNVGDIVVEDGDLCRVEIFEIFEQCSGIAFVG